MKTQPRFKWVDAIFLVTTPIVGIIGTITLSHFDMIMWQTWVFFGIYLFATSLAITAGYHRLFSHRTYTTKSVIRFIFLMLAAASFQGSALEWCTDHRDHHRFIDTEKDPYCIKEGFWHAHIGWIFIRNDSHRDYSNIEDLTSSAFLRFEHKYFNVFAIFMGLIFPAIIASLWGNMLAGFIVVGVLRIVIVHHSTFLINSLCHWAGTRPYSDTVTARDHWATALITAGEGFHNFHHQFPLDYRNGVRFFHYDPTKWLIYGLSKVGLAHNLKRVSRYKILSFRLKTEEKEIRAKQANNTTFIRHKIEPLKTHLTSLINNAERLEVELTKLKTQKNKFTKDHCSQHKHQLLSCLKQIKIAQKEWRQLGP